MSDLVGKVIKLEIEITIDNPEFSFIDFTEQFVAQCKEQSGIIETLPMVLNCVFRSSLMEVFDERGKLKHPQGVTLHIPLEFV